MSAPVLKVFDVHQTGRETFAGWFVAEDWYAVDNVAADDREAVAALPVGESLTIPGLRSTLAGDVVAVRVLREL